MSKIIKLNESEITKIIKSVIVENNSGDFKDFETEVELDIDYPGILADGKEIEDFIYPNRIPIKFDLEFYVRRYGIETIMVTNIRGPKEIEVELTFLADEKENEYDDYYEVTHKIPINWGTIELNRNSDSCGDIHTGVYSVQIDLDEGLFVDGVYYTPFPQKD